MATVSGTTSVPVDTSGTVKFPISGTSWVDASGAYGFGLFFSTRDIWFRTNGGWIHLDQHSCPPSPLGGFCSGAPVKSFTLANSPRGETILRVTDIKIDTPPVPLFGGFSSIDFKLNVNFRKLLRSDDYITGGSGNDRLFGHKGNDTLRGNEGNDLLHGGAGTDIMIGGLGDDRYVVDNATDVVIEAQDEGTDTVNSTVSYALGPNLENLVLSGKKNIDGFGNDLDNILTGNKGSNTLIGYGGDDTLIGGKGADVMFGGTGNDTYHVEHKKDVVVEYADEGIDTVMSTRSYALGENVENLILLGKKNLNGFGNALDNTLTGNAGANKLFGGAGNDTLNGGLGKDVLTGGAGNDTLNGGLGKDVLTGGAGNDRFVFDTPLGSGNVDTIADFESGIDTIWLDQKIFAALPSGTLSAAQFVSAPRAVALDADDFILQDSVTGNLFYDGDANGPGAAVQFAQVSTNTLIAGDIFVYV